MHIMNLLMNTLRNAVESLSRSGVGYIDLEQTGEIYYCIDDKRFLIQVKDVTESPTK